MRKNCSTTPKKKWKSTGCTKQAAKKWVKVMCKNCAIIPDQKNLTNHYLNLISIRFNALDQLKLPSYPALSFWVTYFWFATLSAFLHYIIAEIFRGFGSLCTICVIFGDVKKEVGCQKKQYIVRSHSTMCKAGQLFKTINNRNARWDSVR